MIICGYQGIGKSSLAKSLIDDVTPVLDLESGNFWVDGMRADDWYKIYANIAIHLSQQTNIVMLSSHKVVRDHLHLVNSGERLATIYPSIELKDQWIEKLQQRYDLTKKDKDYKALMNAKEMYEENIRDLDSQVGFDHICIHNINYKLYDIISTYAMMLHLYSEDDNKSLYAAEAEIILKGAQIHG